ncbi:Hint domain-containing protein [uncultured Sulfitobacter sp.]|uniref:Hint domain-containing protein n=1 Tax=uncultured Sulfitobacter sp. TaxID=191468 RepID=UPI0026222E70|nr:Hint domain-containing protein [uncultured Sulfitobacter sp.]
MADIIGTPRDDSLAGTDENDLITTGQGNDTLAGRSGDDELRAEEGNDFLFGEDGNDTLLGGDGIDDLFGGAGDDYIDGGTGNDLISGGKGSDTLIGGLGKDIFYDLNPGDIVTGGEHGNVDYDSLNLTKSANGGKLKVVVDEDNPENGTVYYTDADGKDVGKIVFSEIEQIIPCFTPGTRIATPRGEVAVETLAVGDRVVTRDNGLQVIRWIGRRDLTAADLLMNQHMSPVCICKGGLGNDLPERDMMVSPNHRMLVASEKTVLYFEESEVLVAAKHLTGLPGVAVARVQELTYIHLMFDHHEVILSDGTWSESFQPGLQSLAGVGNAQRTELFELFPELATMEGVTRYASARRSIKAHEAALLVK